MYKVLKLVFVLLLASLSGCSQKMDDTKATIKAAFWNSEDVSISKQHIESLPYSSMLARINDGPQILMILAFVERNPSNNNQQLKWVSADKAMIVTENGRIVKTLRLPQGNLVNLDSSTNNMAPSIDATEWTSIYDWQPDYFFNQSATIQSKHIATQTLNSLIWTKDVQQINESIHFEQLDRQETNSFWVDTQGNVVKSEQWVIPDTLKIETEILKPYREL